MPPKKITPKTLEAAKAKLARRLTKTLAKKQPAPKVPKLDWHAEAVRLHVSGLTVAEISRKLQKPFERVRDGITAELAKVSGDFADRVNERREIVSHQLDRIIRGSIEAADEGDANSAFVVIAALEKKTKLFGLAAAEKVDITGGLSLSFDAHVALMSRLEKLIGPSEEVAPVKNDLPIQLPEADEGTSPIVSSEPIAGGSTGVDLHVADLGA